MKLILIFLAASVVACGQDHEVLDSGTNPQMCPMTGYSLVIPEDAIEVDGQIYVPCGSVYASK